MGSSRQWSASASEIDRDSTIAVLVVAIPAFTVDRTILLAGRAPPFRRRA